MGNRIGPEKQFIAGGETRPSKYHVSLQASRTRRANRYRSYEPHNKGQQGDSPRRTVYCDHCEQRGPTKLSCWDLQRHEEDKQNQARLSRISRGTNYTAGDGAPEPTDTIRPPQPPRSDINYVEGGFSHMPQGNPSPQTPTQTKYPSHSLEQSVPMRGFHALNCAAEILLSCSISQQTSPSAAKCHVLQFSMVPGIGCASLTATQ